MPWAKVLRSGQVTFPKEVRESLNLKEGDIVDFEIQGSAVVIRPKVMIDKGKAEVWKMFDEMHEKMKDEDPQKIEKLIKAIAANKIRISNISMHEPTIDDVFLKLTGSEVRDTEGAFTSARGNMMAGRR